MKETIAMEIRSFIGLLIYKGLYKLNTFRIAKPFQKDMGNQSSVLLCLAL